MALTKSSVLHYWSSRYGINPRIGGRPVFTRNSAGVFVSQEGEVNTAIVNTPRFDWATVSGERRKILTLEMARTNNTTYATDLINAAWTKLSTTVTSGKLDPAGGTSAFTVTSTAVNGEVYNGGGGFSSIVRSTSMWIRRRTGVGTVMLWDSSAILTAVAVTDKWQRFSLVAAASTNRYSGVRCVTSGDAVDVYLPQNEDGAFATSEIATTTAAATRATDSCYWNFPPVPQGFYAYVRFIERGCSLLGPTSSRVLEIGDVSDANPRFIVYAGSSGYVVYFHNGTAAVTSTLGVWPAIGDAVELVAQLQPSGVVQLNQSLNGAPISGSAGSSGQSLPASWADSRLWLSSGGTVASNYGVGQFAEVKFVKFADVAAATNQTIFDELAAFEVGPNGDIL